MQRLNLTQGFNLSFISHVFNGVILLNHTSFTFSNGCFHPELKIFFLHLFLQFAVPVPPLLAISPPSFVLLYLCHLFSQAAALHPQPGLIHPWPVSI